MSKVCKYESQTQNRDEIFVHVKFWEYQFSIHTSYFRVQD